jgi:hypothetical protein
VFQFLWYWKIKFVEFWGTPISFSVAS